MKFFNNYILTQIYEYDCIDGEVIETRAIKKEIKECEIQTNSEKHIQILKAQTKFHKILDVPKNINEQIMNGNKIAYSTEITENEAFELLRINFNLFTLDIDNFHFLNNKIKTCV